MAQGVPEVRQLQLVTVDDRLNGDALRGFLTQVASYRSRLILPRTASELTWRSIGLDYDGQPCFTSWSKLLRRMHHVLSLPECLFKKSSETHSFRLEALEKVRRRRGDVLAYSVMFCQHSA